MNNYRYQFSLCVVAIFLLAAGVFSAQAGQTLSVRLIHATQQQQASSSGLSDVAGVLQRSLPYNHFSLKGSTSMRLPAGETRSLGGYSVQCSGAQGQLKIQVRRGNKALINTTVALRDKTPLVLGGLPASTGKLLLVFVAR
ncbi:MAG: hypothetical protein ISS35_06390 [Kiritimatiellae bacterium]|nr:hypothetical protein [Kiritimatiellia bacterium]